MTDLEQRMLKIYRSMDDECQDMTLRVAKGWADLSPRHKSPVLKLIEGGARAVPMRKRMGERAQTV